MATGSISKFHLVVVPASSVSFTEEFDLDDAMTMPENPLARQQGVARWVSNMPAVHNATGVCSICMESLGPDHSDKEDARQVSCGHIYHHDCINNWLLNGNSYSCPLCRHDISG